MYKFQNKNTVIAITYSLKTKGESLYNLELIIIPMKVDIVIRMNPIKKLY